MSKYLAVSLIIVSFILGSGFGFILTPEYKEMAQSDNSGHNTDLGIADRYVDLRFIESMIKHHQGAISLAESAKNESKRGIIKDLADKILNDQKPEMQTLYNWRKDWFNKTAEIKPNEKIHLGSFDEKFDLRFLNSMIAHHEEAVDLANQIKSKSSRNEILNLADEIINKQTEEIEFMKILRGDLYEVNKQEHI